MLSLEVQNPGTRAEPLEVQNVGTNVEPREVHTPGRRIMRGCSSQFRHYASFATVVEGTRGAEHYSARRGLFKRSPSLAGDRHTLHKYILW